MTEEILKFTKLTFVIHFVIVLLYTVLFWLPEFNTPLYGLTNTAPLGALSLMLGSCFTGLAIGALFGLFAKEWKQVRIVVIIDVAMNVTMLIALTLTLSVFNALIYIAVVLTILLIVLFCLTFLQQEDTIKTLW